MKKLFVFLLIVLCLISTFHFKSNGTTLLDLQNIEKVCFVSSEDINVEGVESLESGNLFYNFCSVDVAKAHFDEFQKACKGIQVYINDTNIEKILKTFKAQKISQSEIADMEILNCYTPFSDNSVFVEGKKINLQLAIKQNQIIAGFPVILTGY